MEEILLANAAIALVEKLAPRIEAAFKSGEVSAEDQASLMNRIESLRAKAAGQFTGPQWKPSGV